MYRLRYYCQGKGNTQIAELLQETKDKQNVIYEIVDLSKSGGYDSERERQVYESDFKPRAKLLKRRTGEAITELRGGKHHYCISIPGTIAIIKDDQIEGGHIQLMEY